MSNELKGLIIEHDSICKELRRLTSVTSKLRKRKKELDENANPCANNAIKTNEIDK